MRPYIMRPYIMRHFGLKTGVMAVRYNLHCYYLPSQLDIPLFIPTNYLDRLSESGGVGSYLSLVPYNWIITMALILLLLAIIIAIKRSVLYATHRFIIQLATAPGTSISSNLERSFALPHFMAMMIGGKGKSCRFVRK